MIKHLEYTEREALLAALELVNGVHPDDPLLYRNVDDARKALDAALTTDETED